MMDQTQDNDIRDLAAMFAMAALIMKGYSPLDVSQEAFTYADEFMRVRVRDTQPAEGIVAINKRNHARKSAS